MAKPFRVIQIGFGSLGRHIASAILKRENLELVAVVDANPDLSNKTIGELVEGVESDIILTDDLRMVLKANPADVAIVATASALKAVTSTIEMCLENGLDVVSICEELSFPFHYYPKLSEELDQLAKSHKVSIVGTGINPGYLMDLLPIVITAPCQ